MCNCFCYCCKREAERKVKMNLPKLEISLFDILEILGDYRRPFIEAEQIFLADHIVLCGFKYRTDQEILIVSYVTQTSKINDIPHEVTLKVEVSECKKVICCHCTCPAGAGGKCKHIFGSLLYVNRYQIENLQELSCTDVRQKWGKVKKHLNLPYQKIIPIHQYCHFNTPNAKIKYQVSDELKKIFFETLTSGQRSSNNNSASAPASLSSIGIVVIEHHTVHQQLPHYATSIRSCIGTCHPTHRSHSPHVDACHAVGYHHLSGAWPDTQKCTNN
ncbi:uncharacterized protein LOC111694300 [Trichogramma pretiosum]|uniref:uncharacterized protein LOC111694300 n=1 Tax=Trichogramma pretiosum TaxID=7493 RepID=UPI000C71A615|nr:uncharacterized protein LOC111694300 [Trichogramma pretiosum]